MRRYLFLLVACLTLAAGLAGRAMALDLPETWPEAGADPGTPVRFPSLSPFTPAQVADAPPVTGVGTLFLPEPAANPPPAAAVVLLHGSGGVLAARELAYARQLARLGVAALVVDSFASRRDLATGYVDRLLAITESMLAADAYAALAWLSSRPDIDATRVALVGFSYGGLASLYAANAGVADRLARGPRRFAGHAAYYAPCIGEFADPRTTGAPVLMQAGTLDETIDLERCRATAEAFRARRVRHPAGDARGRPPPVGRRARRRLAPHARHPRLPVPGGGRRQGARPAKPCRDDRPGHPDPSVGPVRRRRRLPVSRGRRGARGRRPNSRGF
jgi:dienelactone hydrolase